MKSIIEIVGGVIILALFYLIVIDKGAAFGNPTCNQKTCTYTIPSDNKQWQDRQICYLDKLSDELALQILNYPLEQRVAEAQEIRELDIQIRDLKRAFQKRWGHPPSCMIPDHLKEGK